MRFVQVVKAWRMVFARAFLAYDGLGFVALEFGSEGHQIRHNVFALHFHFAFSESQSFITNATQGTCILTDRVAITNWES